MYKILIVEDEMIERESLKSIISDLELGYLQVETADNGEAGIEKYHSFQPDIILTDINMPRMNGLDMIKKIREENQEVVWLVLTSYDYFSYAQRAIQLGVVEYILKPADPASVKKSITKASENIQKGRNLFTQTNSLVKKVNEVKSILESECFYAILTRQDESKVIKAFKMNNVKFCSALCIVFNDTSVDASVITAFRKHVEEVGYECVQGEINKLYVLFIVSNHKMQDTDVSILNESIVAHQLTQYDFGVGSLKYDITDLYQTYEEALYDSKNKNSETKLIKIENQLECQIENFVINWVNKFMDNIDVENQNLIKLFTQEVIHFNEKTINQIIRKFVQQIAYEIEQRYQIVIDTNDFETLLVAQKNYQNLEIVMNQIINKIMKPAMNLKYQNASYLMKKAMVYIEKNYSKPISLNDLSNELSVSSFYISKILNKESGKNFTEIVNDLRIKEAKKLIKDNFMFKEIAFQVGFASQSYFAKIFKKKVGMSPKEYRNLFR